MDLRGSEYVMEMGKKIRRNNFKFCMVVLKRIIRNDMGKMEVMNVVEKERD